MNNIPTVEVPRVWLVRLMELNEAASKNASVDDLGSLHRLYGYIESAVALLK